MHSLIWHQEPPPSLQALTGGSTGTINPAHFDADHHSHDSGMARDNEMLHAFLPACPDMQESEKLSCLWHVGRKCFSINTP